VQIVSIFTILLTPTMALDKIGIIAFNSQSTIQSLLTSLCLAVQMMDWNKQTVCGLIYRNGAGGLYQPGRMYQLPRKTKVAKVYLQLCEEQARPSVNETASFSKVGWTYANIVGTELKAIGIIVDPKLLRKKNSTCSGRVRSSTLCMRCSFWLSGQLTHLTIAQLCTRVEYTLWQSGILPVHS
jgi:hypothetical protein